MSSYTETLIFVSEFRNNFSGFCLNCWLLHARLGRTQANETSLSYILLTLKSMWIWIIRTNISCCFTRMILNKITNSLTFSIINTPNGLNIKTEGMAKLAEIW
uniref:Uncharacterized protein n=1 Tax=Cacopsylla melanoneura TaxID=428564 RepID=A0A8D8QTQ3_9HEMI